MEGLSATAAETALRDNRRVLQPSSTGAPQPNTAAQQHHPVVQTTD